MKLKSQPFMVKAIIIGYASSHFQSLKFRNNISPWHNLYVPFNEVDPRVDFSITFPDVDVVRKRQYDKILQKKTPSISQ